MAELTERDLEVLADLDFACRNHLNIGMSGWVRPLDCGGTNASDHSRRLAKLVKRGLAEMKRRGGFSRGSRLYRISETGKARLTHKQGHPHGPQPPA